MNCPNCTTELDRVNAGRALCPNCGAEYFISEKTIYPRFKKPRTEIVLEEWPPLPEAPDLPMTPPFEGDPKDAAFPKDPMKMPTIQTPYHEDFFSKYLEWTPQSKKGCEVHLPFDDRCILCGEETK